MSIGTDVVEILTDNSLHLAWGRWAALCAGVLVVVGGVKAVSAVTKAISDEAYARALDSGELPSRRT